MSDTVEIRTDELDALLADAEEAGFRRGSRECDEAHAERDMARQNSEDWAAAVATLEARLREIESVDGGMCPQCSGDLTGMRSMERHFAGCTFARAAATDARGGGDVDRIIVEGLTIREVVRELAVMAKRSDFVRSGDLGNAALRELDRLAAELDRLRAPAPSGAGTERVAALTAALRDAAQPHTLACPVTWSHAHDCTCGVDALLAALPPAPTPREGEGQREDA